MAFNITSSHTLVRKTLKVFLQGLMRFHNHNFLSIQTKVGNSNINAEGFTILLNSVKLVQ